MPEIAAFALQTALTPTVAAPLENAGVPAGLDAGAGQVQPAPSFDALLALQATVQAATPAAASPSLPESGKALPDTANRVAAKAQAQLSPAILLKAGMARPAANLTAQADTPVHAQTEETADDTADFVPEDQIAPEPDIALFAAIFAAPERLAQAAATQPSAQPAAPPQDQPSLAATAPIATTVAPTTPATPNAVAVAAAVAIASAAQIEQVLPAPKGTAPRAASAVASAAAAPAEQAVEATPASPAAPVTASVVPPLRVAAAPSSAAPASDGTAVPRAQKAPTHLISELQTPEPQTPMPQTSGPQTSGPQTPRTPASEPRTLVHETSGLKTTPTAPEASTPQFAEATLPGTIAADAPVQSEIQPATPARSEAKAERIDFATLVETLNRAREEASPRTLNVAVTNTDFGRVALRFDSTDAGLSVTMSAADPGFVRAVSASSEAAATSTDTRSQSGQPQADTGATRQQQGQPSQQQQQQAGPARSDARPLANAAPTSRRDDDAASGSAAPGDSGIYA
ncbi:MAG: hypothetical protein B7Y36_15820 [Novosphingobium sp. 28-62-57]|uniref:hypothetical protein n=1 Tax=unclassified Novosphingobium TaxID=2644732 RepID=UPI000BDB3A6C|nr:MULTISPECIES: hypothetical protein [unclassified Novosphingobium]OYW47589.1 MAG: hypothetical protein B7Z36_02925 [Novosphingobium sp. 12-63-9]OYZ08820.1 MAG: hypothetical protein B7Y36_15820 [Novosphingobium sp. 28-62-57]HQS69920.1 hypothetical protein [Novosphingobium sp.]